MVYLGSSWRGVLAWSLVCVPGAGRVDVIQNGDGSRTTPSWVAFSAQDGTVVGLLTDGMAVYVLHYTDAWEDLTAQTSAIAALVAAAL